MREVFFEYQKKKKDQLQNDLSCMKFKSLKKCYQRVKSYNESIMNQINQLNKESAAINNNNFGMMDKRQSNVDMVQLQGSAGQGVKDLTSVERNKEQHPLNLGQQDNDQYQNNNKINNILSNIENNNQIGTSPISQGNNNNPNSNGQDTAIFPASNFNSFISQGQANTNNNPNNNPFSQINSNQQSFTNITYPLTNINKQAISTQNPNNQQGYQPPKMSSTYQMPSQKQLNTNFNQLPSVTKRQKNRDLSQSINLNNGGNFLSARRPANNINNQNQTNNIQRKRSLCDKKNEEQALEEKLQKYNSEKIQIVETVHWKDLIIGDIVILKRGQVAPADLLILESKGGRCSVDCSTIQGICDELIKKPTTVTSISDGSKIKQSVFEYRKILNGKIEYSSLKLKEGFKGFIKLSKDPKGEEIDNNNMIFRGSILRNCKWIYGLVLYAGHDCLIYKQSKGMASLRKSFFAGKAQTFYTISLFQIILNILVI